MAKKKDFGRIYFPGNPWPKGHAITQFQWSARVDRSSGIWFDLHLETDYYYADDREEIEDRAKSDWASRIVWCNYHSCTLSSVNWVGECYGFHVQRA